jgi:hypothetical protein
LVIALTLWVVYVAVPAGGRDRRRVELFDAGVGVALVLATCALVVASEPATGVVVVALVVYGMVLAALAWAVRRFDRLGRFQAASSSGPIVRPTAHKPAISDCHRRPQLDRRTRGSRPPCVRRGSDARAADRRREDVDASR